MTAKKRTEYVPLAVGENDTFTDTEPSAEALEVQRALLKRSSEERVSLSPLDPATALRALLATPSRER